MGLSSPVWLTAAVVLVTGSIAFGQQRSREQRQEAQVVYLSLGDEPPSLDPTKQVDAVSYFWLGHMFEGLLAYDEKGVLVPGAAESFKVSPDQLTYTFTLRRDGKWHDGKPVTAQDFEFAFRRLVEPSYASEYSFMAGAAGIVHADEVVGKKLPVTALGAHALDDRTFEVKLSRPVPYFASLMAFQVFFPIRKDLAEKYADKFAASAESLIGNGPFKLASWQKEQSIRLEKAETYWNRGAIRLTAIESPALVKDAQANFNNFRTGGIDLSGTSTPEIIKQAQDARLKIHTFPSGCVEYLNFNVRPGRPFADRDLRRAVQAGISRAEFVNKIIGIPGYKPAYGIVPDHLPGSKTGIPYRKEAPLTLQDADQVAAKKHLAAYRQRTGQDKVPSFTILAGDSSIGKKYAEYFQNTLVRILGAEVRVETVPFKTQLQKGRDGQFDVMMGGWCPDYRDPMTYMDLLTTKNSNNYSGWSNKSYDDLISQASKAADPVARVKIFAEAEALLTAEAPIVPTDQTGGAFVTAPGLTGVRRNSFGVDPDLHYARWEKTAAGKPAP